MKFVPLFDRFAHTFENHHTVNIAGNIDLFEMNARGVTDDPLEVLRDLIHKVGITDFRIGIRWSDTQREHDTINLTNTLPLIQYALEQGCKLTICLGPIKSPRWPEEHIPDWVLNSINKSPMAFGRLKLSHDIVPFAQNYLRTLLDTLLPQIDSRYLSRITWQLENEGQNPFGGKKWIMSDEYLESVYRILAEYIPHSRVLINSNGRFQLHSIVRIINSSWFRELGFFPVIGLDYYYVSEWSNKYPIAKYFDWFNFPTRHSIPYYYHPKDLTRLVNTPFEFEITEAQFEPWHSAVGPGASQEHYNFLLQRIDTECGGINGDEPLTVRLWGLEYYYAQFRQNKK